MFINVIKSMRPAQFTKSLFVFFPILFSINEAWRWDDYQTIFPLIIKSTVSLLVFTLASSSVYLLNDVIDREKDRLHPRKRYRPIASGVLEVKHAVFMFVMFAVASLALSLFVNLELLFTLFSYLLLMITYGFILRNIVLFDVFTIVIGFVIRVLGGALAVEIPISAWLYVCMGFGSLFIVFSKRFAEISCKSLENYGTRKTLEYYSSGFLKLSVSVALVITLVAYSLYIFFASNLPANNTMMITIPIVSFGMFRYLYLVLKKGKGERPEELILKDIPLIVSILGWVASVIFILNLYR